MATGTAGMDGVDLLMGFHRAGRKIASAQEISDQCLEAFHLFWCGAGFIEIAHEANAEASLIEETAGKVAAIDLIPPTRANGNFAIRHAASVADNEVIREPVFHAPFFPMIPVHSFGGAIGGAGMVDDNMFPTFGWNLSAIEFLEQSGRESGAGGIGEEQFLADKNFIGMCETVLFYQESDCGLVFFCDAAEGVIFSDDISVFGSGGRGGPGWEEKQQQQEGGKGSVVSTVFHYQIPERRFNREQVFDLA
jgi:hypothetical protein